MSSRFSNLAQIIQSHAMRDGISETLMPGVDLIKHSSVNNMIKHNWQASYAIIIQGAKNIELGNDTLIASQGHCLVSALELPVMSCIEMASGDKPFLALRLSLDFVSIREISSKLQMHRTHFTKSNLRSIFVHQASDSMLDAATRLVKLLNNPIEAQILGPMLIKELVYHLLRSSDGELLYQFFKSGNKLQKIMEVASYIKDNLTEKIDIQMLSEKTNMSRSAFFACFKEVTSLTPIGYQKRFRLLEARRLLIEERYTSEQAGWSVGYKSAAQFSREYIRMFGDSPARDAKKSKSHSMSYKIDNANK